MSLGRVLKKLQALGELDIIDMNLDGNSTTCHRLKHRFREEVLVPYLGVTENGTFFTGKGEHYVTTADGIVCKVIQWEEIHICEAEDLVQKMYKMSAWDYLKRWYNTDKAISSMYLLRMKLEKYEPQKNNQ